MTRKELELFTDIRDLTNPFYMILRHGSFEWLEWSIDSDLIRYVTCNMEPPLMIILSSNTISDVQTGY